jgi:glycosyltransferase involved in cell wall biosynthesis
MDGISVVIPCFNREKFLGPCLESVFGQDYRGPVEVLVGDDGSTDASARVAASYGAAVRVLRHPGGENRGVAATRNLCLRAARHPLIAFLDADDLWLPGHLTALAGALAAHPEAGMAYDNGCYLGADGRTYGNRLGPDHTALDPETLLLNCSLAVNGILARRQAFEEVGGFDETLRSCEDQDMWLRILERYPAVYVPVQGFLYRQHGHQLTKSAELWGNAGKVLTKARQRYPYRPSAVRKRAAVISYRQGECALHHRRLVRGVYHLGKAAWYDPTRAVGELTRRLRGQATP